RGGRPCGCAGTVVVFFSSRSRHTSFSRDWSSDVCSSDLAACLRAHRPCAAGSDAACARRPASLAFTRTLLLVSTQGKGQYLMLRSEERRVGKEGRSRWSRER